MAEQASWRESVARAKQGSLSTMEGRFEIADASFEQIPQREQGGDQRSDQKRRGIVDHGELLRQFGEEVGIELPTLREYRGVVFWWGARPPRNLSWSALREGMREYEMGADFREWLKGKNPKNGTVWTVDELRAKWGRPQTNTGRINGAIANKIAEDPEARREAAKALEKHYTQEAKERSRMRRQREAENAGGEDALSRKEQRAQANEVVSVARGAASSLRYVASQADAMSSDERLAESLTAALEEAISYAEGALRILSGETISDKELAEWTS